MQSEALQKTTALLKALEETLRLSLWRREAELAVIQPDRRHRVLKPRRRDAGRLQAAMAEKVELADVLRQLHTVGEDLKGLSARLNDSPAPIPSKTNGAQQHPAPGEQDLLPFLHA